MLILSQTIFIAMPVLCIIGLITEPSSAYIMATVFTITFIVAYFILTELAVYDFSPHTLYINKEKHYVKITYKKMIHIIYNVVDVRPVSNKAWVFCFLLGGEAFYTNIRITYEENTQIKTLDIGYATRKDLKKLKNN